MLEREPTLVCLTITGERTEVALIGVFLVILGFELDPPDLDLDRLEPLEPREPPDLPPPPRPLVSDNSTITIRTIATSNTVANRILANSNDE